MVISTAQSLNISNPKNLRKCSKIQKNWSELQRKGIVRPGPKPKVIETREVEYECGCGICSNNLAISKHVWYGLADSECKLARRAILI